MNHLNIQKKTLCGAPDTYQISKKKWYQGFFSRFVRRLN